MMYSHVLPDGRIARDRVRLTPYQPDLTEGRWVPADPPAHDPDRFRAVPIEPVTGEAVTYTLEPITPPVPLSVSRFQAKAALSHFGHLATIEAVMGDPQTPALYRLAWADAVSFERSAQTVAAMAGILNLTEEQTDDLFRYAAGVTA